MTIIVQRLHPKEGYEVRVSNGKVYLCKDVFEANRLRNELRRKYNIIPSNGV